ncbi:hypothetical protein BH20BAC1_BH20BAC1_05250 [soil metagenome]
MIVCLRLQPDQMLTERNLPDKNKLKKHLKRYLQYSLTLIGIILNISFQEIEVYPNGFLQELNQMALRLKLQDATYLLLRMVK